MGEWCLCLSHPATLKPVPSLCTTSVRGWDHSVVLKSHKMSIYVYICQYNCSFNMCGITQSDISSTPHSLYHQFSLPKMFIRSSGVFQNSHFLINDIYLFNKFIFFLEKCFLFTCKSYEWGSRSLHQNMSYSNLCVYLNRISMSG